MIQIEYNNINPFEDICNTPFVEFGKNSDGWWSSTKSFNLNGQIVCCGLSFEEIIDKQKKLINNFNKNFSNFKIIETDSNETLINCNNAFVKNINFEESDYVYLLPFNIEIEAYDDEAFQGNYFIIDPKAEYSIEEQKDGLISYSFSISAKGLAGNNRSPIENAEQWVKSIVAIDSSNPNLITFNFPGLSKSRIECDPNNPGSILFEQTENGTIVSSPNGLIKSDSELYDRAEGTYARNIEFVVDPKNQNGIIFVYKIKGSKNIDSFTEISVEGTIRAKDIDTARARLNKDELFDIASRFVGLFVDNNFLNKDNATFEITENFYENSISFTYSFNTNAAIDAYEFNEITFKSASISENESRPKKSITVNGFGLKGNKDERVAASKAIIFPLLKTFKGTGNILNDPLLEIENLFGISSKIDGKIKVTDESLDENRRDGAAVGTINIEGSNSLNQDEICGLKSLEGSIEEDLPCQQYNFKRNLCSDWIAVKTNMSPRKKRANITLTYAKEGSPAEQAALKEEAMNYVNVILQQIAIGTLIKSVVYELPHEFQVVYEYEWEEITIFEE